MKDAKPVLTYSFWILMPNEFWIYSFKRKFSALLVSCLSTDHINWGIGVKKAIHPIDPTRSCPCKEF